MYKLNKKENLTFKSIKDKYYMKPPVHLIDYVVSKSKNKKKAWKDIFDQLHKLMTCSKEEVDKLIESRKKKGDIKDVRQARVSIAGNMFSYLIIYIFLNNKIYGNIREDIYITNKVSEVKDFKEITTIKIGEETQKPDVDLIIYTKNKDESMKKCIILSLKTSLRERAGQTYKWKLLMEIATTENDIKKKYDIEYNPQVMPLVCFATVNFYNEINNPQQRGMFKFFDRSFIGKKIRSNFIKRLSDLMEYANKEL